MCKLIMTAALVPFIPPEHVKHLKTPKISLCFFEQLANCLEFYVKLSTVCIMIKSWPLFTPRGLSRCSERRRGLRSRQRCGEDERMLAGSSKGFSREYETPWKSGWTIIVLQSVLTSTAHSQIKLLDAMKRANTAQIKLSQWDCGKFCVL